MSKKSVVGNLVKVGTGVFRLAILSSVLPENRLMRFWSSVVFRLDIRSAGIFSRIVISWDTRARVTPKWFPAAVCVL